MAAPNAYNDPYYQDLASATEQKLGLPVGLLNAIVQKGERSNADQVSEAGAKSVFQITPPTRKAAIDKYGIDPYLNAQNAAEVAGRLLKDSLDRNKGDESQAIGEYIGGTDRSAWGPKTKAYIARVSAGQSTAKADALASGFSQFMAANPAVPVAKLGAAVAPADDALAAGFGNFLKQKATSQPGGIPEDYPGQAQKVQQETAASVAGQPARADQTLVDKIIGGGETALSLASGATTGALGMALGGIAGGVDNLTNGALGIGGVEEGMRQGAEAGTYAPRTMAGQDMTGAAGDALAATLPMVPLTGEMAAAGRAASSASTAARAAVPVAVDAGVQRIRAAAPAVADRVQRTLRLNRDPEAAQAAGGSVGAAGADVAAARSQVASDLPVPIKLTAGQETRDPTQLRFETETAKGDQGAPLRQRAAEQNEAFQKNFDAFVDQTEAQAVDGIEVGKSVDSALRKEAARDKAEIRVAYKKAEQAGEGEAPVTLSALVDHLNESAPDAATAPLLDVARARAIRLGIAAEGEGGDLVPLETTLKNAERYRQAVGQATNYDAPNIRQSAIIKGLVDSETESAAGSLYRSARRLRENFAKKYEDNAMVSKLMNLKRGTSDRQVALEDTFKHSILDADRADLTRLRRALTATGSEQGTQAWKDLQGATISWLRDEATKNVATDQAGNRIVSAAQLDRAIKKLERGNKLDFVLGKKGAETIRDMNDLAKVLFTQPPGVVNHSNTASVVLAALTEAGITGSVTGLPVPVLSALKLASKQVKDYKVRARIQRALNPEQARRNPAA